MSATNKQGAPEPIAALNRVKITEYAVSWEEREPLVDIRVTCPDVVLSERVCPFLRVQAAEKLNRAQRSLAAGYRLKVGTALRTLSMQKHGWDGYFERIKAEHPQWPLSALRRTVNKYYAPYDQSAPPGHCTGGAVDVGLLDPDGNSLDMTAPTTGWEAAYTWSDKISAEARSCRMQMVEAMLGAGFSNCRDEYWHYSWGDSAWAVRVGENECPYGWAHPPVCLETDFADASAVVHACHTVRDMNGRAIRADAHLGLAGDTAGMNAATLAAGLYWAKGVPVSVCVDWPETLPAPQIFVGSGPEDTIEIKGISRSQGTLDFEVLPQADRVFISNVAPKDEASAAPTEG